MLLFGSSLLVSLIAIYIVLKLILDGDGYLTIKWISLVSIVCLVPVFNIVVILVALCIKYEGWWNKPIFIKDRRK